MIIGYARVSTDKVEQDTSIEGQIQQLYGAGCDRVISERKSAFKDGTRPGWEELLGLVASGRVRRVVFGSQQRMSRRGEDVQLFRICARLGIEVRLLDGTPSQVDKPADRMITGVMSVVNEVDSMIKSINIKNGLSRRKAAGHYACGRVPFGYLYDGSQVVPHPERFPEARNLWEQLAAQEFNLPGTIRLHGLDWSPRGLARWIDNPILRGIVSNEPDRVAALISWQEWQQARRLIDSRQRGGTRAPRVIRALSGLVRCSECGKAMHYTIAHGLPRLKCTHLHCPRWGRGLAEWKVINQALEALRGAALLGPLNAASSGEVEPSPEERIKRAHLEQLEALAAQGVPGLAQAIETLRLELLAPPPINSANWTGLQELLLRPGVLEAATTEELRAVLLELVDEVLYVGDPNRVEIRLRDRPSSNS